MVQLIPVQKACHLIMVRNAHGWRKLPTFLSAKVKRGNYPISHRCLYSEESCMRTLTEAFSAPSELRQRTADFAVFIFMHTVNA